jgi:hypothetical protein
VPDRRIAAADRPAVLSMKIQGRDRTDGTAPVATGLRETRTTSGLVKARNFATSFGVNAGSRQAAVAPRLKIASRSAKKSALPPVRDGDARGARDAEPR